MPGLEPFRHLIHRSGTAVLVMGLLVATPSRAEPMAASRPLQLEGVLQQGGLVIGRTAPGSSIRIDGQPVRISDQGVFLIGFDRDAPGTSRLEITSPDGGKRLRQLEIRQREYQIQRIDGLPPSKVTPSKTDLERIREEGAQVKAARNRNDPRTDFLQGFQWPALGPISGVYGSQRILNGNPRRPHYGVDVAAPAGTPVTAPVAGTVTLAHPDMFFSGGTLIIDHGHGLSSSFLHLSRILVEQGQRVNQGDLVAEIGATGRVTGAHLDWRMNLRDARVDPQLLVGPMPE